MLPKRVGLLDSDGTAQYFEYGVKVPPWLDRFHRGAFAMSYRRNPSTNTSLKTRPQGRAVTEW
jgi:hypothetical protein